MKPVLFSRPQCDLVRDRDYSFVDNGSMLSINTLDKRVKVCFETKHWQEYLDGSWNLGTAKLLELKGKWYLHIPVTKAVEEFCKNEVKHVVGIDRGLRFLTVTYDEQGKTQSVIKQLGDTTNWGLFQMLKNFLQEQWLSKKKVQRF